MFKRDAHPVQVVEKACRDGKIQVVKLLLGTMEDSNPVTWLAHTMASLESTGTASTKTAALMAISRYAYNLDHTLTLSTIVRLAEKYPKASLHLLDTFCKQGSNAEHFIKSGVALISSPTQLGHIWLLHAHHSGKQPPHFPPGGTVPGSHSAVAECLTQLHRVHPKHSEMELSLPS